MEIILINHAERDKASGKDDRDQPLDPKKGVEQVEQLVLRLRKRNKPTLYLTSRNAHAKETADRVCEALGGVPATDVVELNALTPDQRTESMLDIYEQAKAARHDLLRHKVIVIVGHSPRLEQLFAYLTFRTAAPKRLKKGQEVYLTIEDFHDGNGQGQWPGAVGRQTDKPNTAAE